MRQPQAKELFQLQAELMDTKIEMSVSKTIDRVVDQISQLRKEMHDEMSGLRKDVHNIERRMVAVETKLGMVNETQKEIRAKFIDYGFKVGWLVIGAMLSSGIIYLQSMG